MKRALTAALFGGLLIFFVPQAASGGSTSPSRVAGYQSTAGENEGGCATKPEGDSAKPEHAPGPQGDHEQHDGPEVLF
jgi:hypothetical protein